MYIHDPAVVADRISVKSLECEIGVPAITWNNTDDAPSDTA
jgi:hypothetical protein